MPRTIIVSLPVADLKASVAFYTALGFVINPQCSGEAGALMVLSETISEVLSAYVPGPKGPVFMRLLEQTLGPDITTRTLDMVRKCAWA